MKGLAPKAALGILAERLRNDENKRKWSQEARAMAVLGSCPHTLQSVQSGWNNYLNYCEVALGSREAGLPPTVDLFLGWSHTHRCVGTFSNYVGHVASACLARGIDCPSTTHPAVVRAKQAIAKRLLFVSTVQGFIKRSMLRSMIGAVAKGWETETFAMLCLFSYVFLLRVPSEALPVVRCCQGSGEGEQSRLWLDGDELCLRLLRRKNKYKGSVLRRKCHCAACPATCPIHVLWRFFGQLPVGSKPFADITASSALSRLRALLEKLKVPDVSTFNTKAFRRGHAAVCLCICNICCSWASRPGLKDMRCNGSTLADILAAGEWRSAAFLRCYVVVGVGVLGATGGCVRYLDTSGLERDAVFEIALNSDHEELID